MNDAPQEIDPDPEDASPVVGPSRPRLLGVLGPGLITGASDDDPSGIATYSQAGAQYGYSLAWTLLLTYPLMCAVQMIAARVGRTTGHGIAGVLRRHYPHWLLQFLVCLLVVANTINLGADLGAMADAFTLILPGPPKWLLIVLFAATCIYVQVFLQYTRYVAVLKWLTLVLFAYFAAVMTTHVDWTALGAGLVWPRLQWDKAFLTTVVAVFGTTISPYLFFWQAAEALRPIAGEFAFLVFAIGIIGTGALAVPVLAGSAAYALGEARQWPVGFSRKWQEAKAFYATVALATLVGMVINFTEIDPIKALYWSAVINGVSAAPVLVTMMLIARRRDIMGAFTIGRTLTVLGWAASVLMAMTIVAMVVL